ncbi:MULTISPECIES: DUF397 domain-containing protein [Streptomyces]|nr:MULTISPECIES: DUF397 domain-containing protein [Streptomyces]
MSTRSLSWRKRRFPPRRGVRRTRSSSSSDFCTPCSRKAYMSRFEWQKSSFSEGHTEACVEVATGPGATRWMRESAEPEVVMGVSVGALGGLVRVVKSGGLGRGGG